MFHVSLLKPPVADPFPDRGPETPVPLLVEGNEEFEAEAVLDCRKRRGQTQFLTKWRARDVHAPRLVQAYLHLHLEKSSLVGIRRLPIRGGNVRELLEDIRRTHVRMRALTDNCRCP